MNLDINLRPLAGLIFCLCFGVGFGLFINLGFAHPYDKIVHAGFFAALLFFAATCTNRFVILSTLAVILAAFGSESLQGLFPGRHMSSADIIANVSGCIVGSILLVTRFKIHTSRNPTLSA